MPIFWAQPMKELPCKCGQNILLVITKEGKTYRKTFSTAEAAAKWRDQKAIELFGEFAFLNYP